ncbi:putative ABC-type ATPase [Catalinimonas alkaloidigena]|uniref:hypothetical protein n=1 Tax=Catalinimonas alkaloidigena TaxID=1075417 RepID=UPI002405E1FA|nr:hypothetical protein [Catalinimonas alkaloidigena]MDF9795053.1 putative ABC-type ATPase [Catalinimonas alkaloidigena]
MNQVKNKAFQVTLPFFLLHSFDLAISRVKDRVKEDMKVYEESLKVYRDNV